MNPILKVENLSMQYPSGNGMLTVLEQIDFSISEGELVSITGPSGSGKTTLLGLCAGLDRPSQGNIWLCGSLINDMNEDERAALRNREVGFIFQNFQLIPSLTALENVMIPLELQGRKDALTVATSLLKNTGLGDRLDHYPAQLSGGEQQRVAIARAFSNSPRILFADEPTGNLDYENAEKIQELLFDLNKEKGTTLIIITHDPELASKTHRQIKLKGGKIYSDISIANSLKTAADE
jgi:putative ABC transport system ATP-binding protein